MRLTGRFISLKESRTVASRKRPELRELTQSLGSLPRLARPIQNAVPFACDQPITLTRFGSKPVSIHYTDAAGPIAEDVELLKAAQSYGNARAMGTKAFGDGLVGEKHVRCADAVSGGEEPARTSLCNRMEAGAGGQLRLKRERDHAVLRYKLLQCGALLQPMFEQRSRQNECLTCNMANQVEVEAADRIECIASNHALAPDALDFNRSTIRRIGTRDYGAYRKIDG